MLSAGDRSHLKRKESHIIISKQRSHRRMQGESEVSRGAQAIASNYDFMNDNL